MKDLLFLTSFMKENHNAGQLSEVEALIIQQLCNEYKLNTLSEDCSIISADFGILGSLVIRNILSFDEATEFKYESGNYDYVSIKTKQTKRILWTDYKDIEPYNRQSELYCDGATFEHFGDAVAETKEYREFNGLDNYSSNISFGVWGFSYNDFYGSIKFGLCIKTDKVEEFISKLRKIIGK